MLAHGRPADVEMIRQFIDRCAFLVSQQRTKQGLAGLATQIGARRGLVHAPYYQGYGFYHKDKIYLDIFILLKAAIAGSLTSLTSSSKGNLMNLNSPSLDRLPIATPEQDLTSTDTRPSRSVVEQALRTIIRWTGDDPDGGDQ